MFPCDLVSAHFRYVQFLAAGGLGDFTDRRTAESFLQNQFGRNAVDGADCLLIDGSFWSNDEPGRHGITDRTAAQMGHLCVGGPQGSLAWLTELPVRHRVYVHINNTNPMLDTDSWEYAEVRNQGIAVGTDGDEFVF